MKKLLLIIGLMFLGTIIYAQEIPNDIKRYDFKEVGRFDGATYTVLVITDCVTNEKEYKLRISYSDEKYGDEVLYFSDGIVAEILKTFHYLMNTQFEPEPKGEKSFIICEVSEGLYFKFRPDARQLDLFVRNHKDDNHWLAGIKEYEIERYGLLLFNIEKTFSEKGRDLKNAVITDDNKKEPLLFEL